MVEEKISISPAVEQSMSSPTEVSFSSEYDVQTEEINETPFNTLKFAQSTKNLACTKMDEQSSEGKNFFRHHCPNCQKKRVMLSKIYKDKIKSNLRSCL